MDPKDRIKRAQLFSKAAQTYEQYAKPQKCFADILASGLKGHLAGKRVLEIGCGTGYFSELLLKEHPSELVLCDISDGMLEMCRKRFKNHPEVKFIKADAECDDLGERYDFIVSNLAFQWFSSMEDGLINLRRHLTLGGVLCFSTFLKGNLREISELSGIGISYPSYMEMIDIVEKVFFCVRLDPGRCVCHYRDVQTMLKELKATGVTSVSNSAVHWTKDRLKVFKEEYAKQFTDEQGIYLTWKGVFVILHD